MHEFLYKEVFLKQKQGAISILQSHIIVGLGRDQVQLSAFHSLFLSNVFEKIAEMQSLESGLIYFHLKDVSELEEPSHFGGTLQ